MHRRLFSSKIYYRLLTLDYSQNRRSLIACSRKHRRLHRTEDPADRPSQAPEVSSNSSEPQRATLTEQPELLTPSLETSGESSQHKEGSNASTDPSLGRTNFFSEQSQNAFASNRSQSSVEELEQDNWSDAFEEDEKNPLTEDEILTEEYLETLGNGSWDEDPPGHRSGYIAILGRPNAGKSTLMNALLGQKLSIVTAKAQTTRHRILSLISEPEYQMVLLDTPGIMAKERNKLDKHMMKAVWQSARSADALIGIIDISANPREALETLKQILNFEDAKRLPFALVLNKVDLVSKTDVESAISWLEANEAVTKILPISAKKGQGIEDVKNWATSQLPLGPTLYPKDSISEEPERFFIAEIVREKIFLQYREEIPYCSTAEVTEYITRPGAKDLVRVNVYIETESQKAILLGSKGSALKKLSTASRLEIEDFLGRPIYLDISVKVQKEWRTDEQAVAMFGY